MSPFDEPSGFVHGSDSLDMMQNGRVRYTDQLRSDSLEFHSGDLQNGATTTVDVIRRGC
jgi:hypothetical protein